jgi:hypothetical protein
MCGAVELDRESIRARREAGERWIWRCYSLLTAAGESHRARLCSADCYARWMLSIMAARQLAWDAEGQEIGIS